MPTSARRAAPSPNLVGRHAHMPPWPGCVDCEPGNSGSPVWRGVGTPPYGPDRKRGVGAACMAARNRQRFQSVWQTPQPGTPFRRGRCPHRPAGLCVQGSPPAAPTRRPMPLYFTAKIPIPWSGRGFSITAPACGRRRPGPRGCCTGSCGTGPPWSGRF